MLKNTLKIIVSMIMCVLSFTFIHIRTTREVGPVEGRNEGHDEGDMNNQEFMGKFAGLCLGIIR